MNTAAAVIQELRQMAEGRYFATHRSTLQAAAETLERISAKLDSWERTFPDKSAEEIALTVRQQEEIVQLRANNTNLRVENAKLESVNQQLRNELRYMLDLVISNLEVKNDLHVKYALRLVNQDTKQPASPPLPAPDGSADLDRRVRLGMTAAREAEMEQLVNDLAENMNLRRWKRADLIQCINWQQWLLCDAARDRADLRLNMLKVITDDMLPNEKAHL